jgi:hypothetical protein
MKDGLPSASTFGTTDIVLDNSNLDIAYAAFWGEGIFKTTDANTNRQKWKKLSVRLPNGNFRCISLISNLYQIRFMH